MPKVSFTSALNRFFPDLKPEVVEARNIAELLDLLETRYPGIKDYLINEDGSLRKHINIFIGEKLLSDREQLSDEISEQDEVLIFQALSGG